MKLIREALTYMPPGEMEGFRYCDILYFTRYLIPLRSVIIASLILTFISSVLATILPLSGKWIIDYIFLRESAGPIFDVLSAGHLGFFIPMATIILTSLPLLILCLAVISVIRYLIGTELTLINYRINTEYRYQVKKAVFSRVMRYPISYFRSTRSAYLLARISNDTGAIGSISANFLQGIITAGMGLSVSGAVLSSLSTSLTFLVMASVPVTVIISYGIIRFNRSYSMRMRESGLRMAADGQDLLESIELIKTHAAEERELSRYMKTIRDNITLNITSMLFGQVTGGIQQSVRTGIRLIIMFVGGNLVLSGGMTIGDYVAFLAMYPQLTGSMSTFLQIPVSLQNTAISAGRVKELLDITTEYDHDDPSKRLIIPDGKTAGHIICEHVTFGYEKGKPVLTDINLEIRPGDRIGFIGPTGTGKTTFISLLLKFYRQQEGHITFDGIDYSDLNPAWIRDQVAVVSQDLLLFHDTIMNNIRYSRPDARDDEVIMAAKSAGIHDEIMEFPEQYQTLAGERGGKLSGGQKQRIAIARAFLRNAPILILDEPTAHLDQQTEEHLMREFLKVCSGKTMIIITHRENVLKLVDRTYRIREGRMEQL